MMGSTYKVKGTPGPPGGNLPHFLTQNTHRVTRNLNKSELGGVIFGCKKETKEECLSKQLFGLPAQHFSYVKNIAPCLPLFLFNYSERILYGIFEAASAGQLNIDPYAWTTDGSGKTPFAAQVLIRMRLSCQPLPEAVFRPIIQENYYRPGKFWFELDHGQASKLISWFASRMNPIVPRSLPKPKQIYVPLLVSRTSEAGEENKPPMLELSSDTSHLNSNGNSRGPVYSVSQDGDYPSSESSLRSENDEKEIIYQKLVDLNLKSDSIHNTHEEEPANENETVTVDDGCRTVEVVEDGDAMDTRVAQLMEVVNELRSFKEEHTVKMSLIEQKLDALEAENQFLKKYYETHQCSRDHEEMESLDERNLGSDVVFLVGGYDGNMCLSSTDLYSLSRDIVKPLQPMTSCRSHASVAKLNDSFYVVGGGGGGGNWYDTVESYNMLNDEWTSQPALIEARGSLATTTVDDKIYAMGGGDGKTCFSDMQMLDLEAMQWICARSMRRKRFALGAVTLNNAIYAVGGYDGKDYLRSAERFDPREHVWTSIESMNVTRGCHSLVVLNEKIYALGGFDGSDMVSSVEVFDPRLGKWTLEGSMNHARGYASAVAFKDAIYMIGGVMDDGVLDSIERYEEGKGWRVTSLKGIGKRCYASAMVL